MKDLHLSSLQIYMSTRPLLRAGDGGWLALKSLTQRVAPCGESNVATGTLLMLMM